MTQPELETFTERSQRLDALLLELSPEHRAVVECLDSDRAVQVRTAERHGAALMQLQEASIAIVRVLESDAIELELARHATRVAGAEGAVVARVARVARVASNEARRAARIVGKLLAFARQNPSEHIPTDINQVVLDTLELRRYALRMQHVQLGVDLAPGLPTVWADPFQLQQVFINLLSNAEKAVVEGGGSGGRIEVSSARGNQGITVSVSDSGAGIAPEHLPHIFNPFYTTKPRGIGTGLGLSISFAIVREHGGFIQAASLPERGATFTVHLPVRDAQIPLR